MRWLTFFSLLRLPVANVFRPNGDATAWLLWNHPTAIYDPPFCAVSATLLINDITFMAQDVVAMTGDCMGDLESPVDCAADITDFMANTLDAAQAAATIAMACAGEVTDCEQLTIDTAETFSSVASNLIGASTNCDIDAFLCLINIVDAVKNIFGAATDIDSALDSCPKITTLEHYLQHKHPGWAGWSWILPRLLQGNLTSRMTSSEGGAGGEILLSTSSSKSRPPSIGLVDATVRGSIIASDEPGLVRVGSAISVPDQPGVMGLDGQSKTRRLDALDMEAYVVPTLHDTDAEVFFFMNYPQEMSTAKLQMAYE